MRRISPLSLLVILGFCSLTACGGSTSASAHSPSLNPCSPEGRKQIESTNAFGKPADGNANEMDAKLPAEKRIAPFDDVNLLADQCRAVLGPIPKYDCAMAKTVPIYQDGKPVEYHDGGVYIDRLLTPLKEVDHCDHPSMLNYLTMNIPGVHTAHPVEGCLPNVRIGVVHTSENVDWVFDCHFRKDLTAADDNDHFSIAAFIGSNRVTGETCFFAHTDGSRERGVFTFYNGSKVPVPGGDGPQDLAGRAASKSFWKTPGAMSCLRCHSFNSPWMVTPHLYQSWLNGDGAFDLIPRVSSTKLRTPQWGFRVIGSVHNQLWEHPKAIYPKNDDGSEDHSCTRCHLLNNQIEGLRLARESVGLPELPENAEFIKGFPRDVSPWMPPGREDDTAFSQAAVQRYQRAFYDPSYRAREAEIVAACPAPSALEAAKVQSQAASDGKVVKWTYANDYGKVPQRDDVRFELEVKGSDGSSCSFRDIKPQAVGSAQWQFRHPVASGVQYEYRLRPYRYCFDRSDFQFATSTTAR